MKQNVTPKLFTTQFSSIQNKYNTRFSKNNYKVPKILLKSSTFSIRHSGPYLWNTFLSDANKAN